MNKDKIDFILSLADSSLILAQRNGEWCGHGPVLEQDIAITNITLDLIGQARCLYQYAADHINQSADQPVNPATEDSLAFLRTEREFKNCLLAEQSNGDWGQTILRQFFFSTYQYFLYQQLKDKGTDTTLSAIAEKSLKEITYHVRWSSEWVIRLGDGTEESKRRMDAGIENLWPYTGELFAPADYEEEMAIDFKTIKTKWAEKINSVLTEATLTHPDGGIFMHTGGKTGTHTEQLGYILAEMQYMQRAFPGCEW